MNNRVNIDILCQNVRNIVEYNKCTNCNSSEGSRIRYSCGHFVCDNCDFGECAFGCSPLNKTKSNKHVPDPELTSNAKNALNLLNTCEKLFNINVFMRQRDLELLKVEKEIFPKCIQAPMKYYNKRKSNIIQNKENRKSLFFEEGFLSKSNLTMEENKNKYVQNWLTQNISETAIKRPRKPLSNLNVNCKISKGSSNTTSSQHTGCEKKRTSGKRPCLRSDSQNKSTNSVPLLKKKRLVFKKDTLLQNSKEDSGIVIDETIIIEDSQSPIKDKDYEALQEVIKQSRKDTKGDKETDDLLLEYPGHKGERECSMTDKVPFYKKSILLETCDECTNITNNLVNRQNNDVSVKIETSKFITNIIIKSSDLKTTSTNINTSSASVQTDIKTLVNKSTHNIKECSEQNKEDNSGTVSSELSEDLFMKGLSGSNLLTVDKHEISKEVNKEGKSSKCLIIEESDSESDFEMGGTLLVTADVHRSFNELDSGILTEVEKRQSEIRTNRIRRESPLSTDSSDKENRDPNRMKIVRNLKKNKNPKSDAIRRLRKL